MSSLENETSKPAGVSTKEQLTPEKQPPLREEKGQFSRKKPIGSGNWEDRTRGIKEWRAKRKSEFAGMVEDWSTTEKRRNPF